MDLGLYRDELLRAATIGVKKWCCPPDELVEGKRHSDTFWMSLFGGLGQRPITRDDAHLFLVTFQLTNRVTWNKPGVAAAIKSLQTDAMFEPETGVPALGRTLTGLNARHTQQTSAASKIATFAKPKSRVYIWDKLASRSARYRDWEREGKKGKPRSALFIRDKQHDYPAFHAACERAMQDERERADFRAALAELMHHFRAGDGPMADPLLVTEDFIERRLLDKLMFAEGWVLDRNLPPPVAWTGSLGM